MICSKCSVDKPNSEFRFVKDRQRYRTVCKACDKVAAAERFQSNSRSWTCRKKEYRRAERKRHNDRLGIEYETREQIAARMELKRALIEQRRAQRRAESEALRPIRIRANRDKDTLRHALRYRTDVDYRNIERRRMADRREERGISYHLSWQIRACFKGNDDARSRASIKRLLGYSLSTLRAHIEAQFTATMTWQQYLDAEIVIDHKKPLRLFNLLDRKQFIEAWSLDNLQPLTRLDNQRKAGKYDEAGQERAA